MTRQSFDHLFASSNSEHLEHLVQRAGLDVESVVVPVCPSMSSDYYPLMISTGSYYEILMDLILRLLTHMLHNVH